MKRLEDDGTEEDFSIAELHIHEDFGSPYKKQYPHYFHFNNDIALVKLTKPVDFSGPYAGQHQGGRGKLQTVADRHMHTHTDSKDSKE